MSLHGWLSAEQRSNRMPEREPWPFGASPLTSAILATTAALCIALFAVGTTTFAFTETKFIAALMLGLVGGAAFLVCGNRRLAALYAVMLLAPLKLGKDFVPLAHQGGAESFVLDAADPFWLMLLFHQIQDWRRDRALGYRFPLVAKLWLLMMLLGVTTMLMGPFKTSAAHEMVRMGKYLVMLLVLINELRRRRQFLHVAFALLLGVMVQSSFSIVSYAAGAQLGLAFLGEETEDQVVELGSSTLKGESALRRPGGLMGHPNQFAGYLALIMPMGVALLFSPISLLMKGLLVATLLLGQVGLLLTLSRSGWICFAAGLVATLGLSFLHRSSRRRYLVARAGVISLIGVVVLIASPKIIERIQYSDPEAWRSRVEFAQTAKNVILAHPVFGVGLNSYAFAQPPYSRHGTFEAMKDFYNGNAPVVHSTWLLTWAELGSVGMAMFVLIHLCVLYVGFRNLKLKDGLLHAMNVGLLSGFSALMLDGLVSFFARMEVGGRMFWVAIALILAIGYWRRTHEIPATVPAPAAEPTPDRTPGRGGWLSGTSRAERLAEHWLGQSRP